MIRKSHAIFVSLFSCACLLTACGSEQKGTGLIPPVQEETATASMGEQRSNSSSAVKIPVDINGVLEQKPGVLVEDILGEKQFAKQEEYERLYKEKLVSQRNSNIDEFARENPNFSSKNWFGYLTHMLGSSGYKETNEKMVAFKPNFKDPEFPTGPDTVKTQDGKTESKRINAMVLLDASGSMKAQVPGGVKMDLAKNAVHTFVKKLPQDARVSMLVYGHKGSGSDADKKLSCGSMEIVYPMETYKETSFSNALNTFKASGWTPLAGAMEQAKKELESYNGKEYQNIVYIVSDGIETCGGDPVQAAKALHTSGIQAKVNIIGFDVDDAGQRQLKAVAEAGAGEYVTVRTKDELEQHIAKKWRPSMLDLAWAHTLGPSPWDQLDEIKRFDKERDKFDQAAVRENARIFDAIVYAHDKKYITYEQYNELNKINSRQLEIKREYTRPLREKKIKEIEAEVDRIDRMIKEWKAQYE